MRSEASGGERAYTDTLSNQKYKFTGKERDGESGLDYFGARYYGSTMGRFLTTDPGPLNLTNPQTFNRYSYVNNNPLKFVDPDGREAQYAVDIKKKTITITVNITLWGPGANQNYASKMKTSIESSWKGTYKDPKTGKVFQVTTKANVSVYNPSTGDGLTARNGFYVGNDVSRSSFQNSRTDARFSSRFPGDKGIYTGAINPGHDAERHEGGHVLGQPDDYWEDPIAGKSGPQPGHEGHLMAESKAKHAAQDEIDRIGSHVLGQVGSTGKTKGTIIQLPEPKKPN